MNITVKPTDLIKLGLWTKFRYFRLGDQTDSEIRSILTEDNAFSINLNDAFVIGLTKVVETENLIHLLNNQIIDAISNKSDVVEGDVLIKDFTIVKLMEDFLENFPKDVKLFTLQQGIIEVTDYVEKLKNIIKVMDKIRYRARKTLPEHTYIRSANMRKLLKPN